MAHIEFNAINLALDAVWRFDGMPEQFYRDWLKVAIEEAYHFRLLRERLSTLAMPTATFRRTTVCGKWRKRPDAMCSPDWRWCRTLEARGLDASPPIRAKLAGQATWTARRCHS